MAEAMIAARNKQKAEDYAAQRAGPKRNVSSSTIATQMIQQKKEDAANKPAQAAALTPAVMPAGHVSAQKQAQLMIRSKTAQKLATANEALIANAKPVSPAAEAASATMSIKSLLPVHTQLTASETAIVVEHKPAAAPTPTPTPTYDTVVNVPKPVQQPIAVAVAVAPVGAVPSLHEKHATLLAQQKQLQVAQAQLFIQQQALAQQQAMVSQQLGEVQSAIVAEQQQQDAAAVAALAAELADAPMTPDAVPAPADPESESEQHLDDAMTRALPAEPVDAAAYNTLDFAVASVEAESARITAELLQMSVEGGSPQRASTEAKKVRFEV